MGRRPAAPVPSTISSDHFCKSGMKKWTEDENAALMRMRRERFTWKRIANAFRVRPDTAKNQMLQVQKLGAETHLHPTHTSWTGPEDDVLLQHFSDLKRAAQLLPHRNINGVRKRRERLIHGLKVRDIPRGELEEILEGLID